MPIIGAPTTRDHMPALMDRGLRFIFTQMHELRNTEYEKLYKAVDSDKRFETDMVMAPMGSLFPKTEGDAPVFDSGQQYYSKVYTHLTWALGWEVTEEAIEDELYGFLKAMAAELGIAAGYTRSVQALDLLNFAATTTVYTADAVNFPLLSLVHPTAAGGTWSNTFATATGLSLDSLETALTNWRTNMVDPRGRKVDIQPKYLCVSPINEGIGARLLATINRPGGNDNDVNWIRTRRNLELCVFDHMTDQATRWFLAADPAQTTLRYNNRRPTRMRRGSEDRSGNLLEIVSYRESHGAAAPVGVYGSAAS
jgi:phage major head subunit gpT-like protein